MLYAAAQGAQPTADEQAQARGTSVLGFGTEEQANAWLALLPGIPQQLGVAHAQGAGGRGLEYAHAALMLLALVRLDASAEARQYGAYEVSDAAVARWLAAAQELGGGATGLLVGAWVELVLKALDAAPAAMTARLTLYDADLVPVEVGQVKGDAAVWGIPLGALADQATRRL